MPVVDDIAPLLGQPLDAQRIAAVVGTQGHELPSDHDPGHPEDERHYYIVPPLGLQMLAGPDRVIRTIFFMIEGDENVSGFPWMCPNGVGPASERNDVRAKLGTPQASGQGVRIGGLPPTGAWDRFSYPPFGSLHVQYKLAGDGIAQMTLMDESAVPRGG